MIIDIICVIAIVNLVFAMFTGHLPHYYLPKLQRRRERLAIAARQTEEEETWRRQALASLKKEDIAFLTAGSHWTPPSEVQYRIDLDKKNEQFAAEQKLRAEQYRLEAAHRQRQIERAATIPSVPERSRQKEIETAARKYNVDQMIKMYRSLGVPFNEVHVADRAEPVAVIPTPPTVDSITRTTTQYGHEIQITHYSDGSVNRETVSRKSIMLDRWHN